MVTSGGVGGGSWGTAPAHESPSGWDEVTQGRPPGDPVRRPGRPPRWALWCAGAGLLGVAIGGTAGYLVGSGSDDSPAAADARASCALVAELPTSMRIVGFWSRSDLVPVLAATDRAEAAGSADPAYEVLAEAGVAVRNGILNPGTSSTGDELDAMRVACADLYSEYEATPGP